MQQHTILRFLISTIAVFITGAILPGIDVPNVWIAMVAASFIAILNTFLRPLLVLLTIPITILSLGLFLFVINGAIILLISEIIDGFKVSSFGMAMVFSLVLSIVTGLLEAVFGLNKRKPMPPGPPSNF